MHDLGFIVLFDVPYMLRDILRANFDVTHFVLSAAESGAVHL